MGTHIFRDIFAGLRDTVGGRSGGYEKELKRAKQLAIEEMVEEARARRRRDRRDRSRLRASRRR
jgi:uncharacterized protein YbjQ (UPF0145 family)